MIKTFLLLILIFHSFINAGLITPSNGQELHHKHVLFEWMQKPNSMQYNLQISNSDSFNILLLDTIVAKSLYIEKNNLEWSNTYFWRVGTVNVDSNNNQWSSIYYFMISEPLFVNQEIVIDTESENYEDSFMLFTQYAPINAVGIIDKFGNEIWHSSSTFISNWNIDGELYGVNNYTNQAKKINFQNIDLWSSPDSFSVDKHEIHELSNGNYMFFVNVSQLGTIPIGHWTQNFQNIGYTANGIENEFDWVGQSLVELNENNEVVWVWNPFDHFTMADYDSLGGSWEDAYYDGYFDWTHSNSFHFDENESVIYISHRNLSRISKISYPSGEIIWNMGLPPEFSLGDDNICTELLFSYQHHIQLLDDGDLLFFDNGRLSPILLGDDSPITRIRRIRVMNDSLCDSIWQYDLPPYHYAHAGGSVQLLDNGNYFISTLGQYSMLEVTSDKEVIWRAHSEPPAGWYRAYKIPSIFPYAFSVYFDQYRDMVVNSDSLTGIILDNTNSSLTFSINNHSGYSQEYCYSLNDSNEWFNSNYDTILIQANQYHTTNIEPLVESDSMTWLTLNVWPINHDYNKKSISYKVYRVDYDLEDDVKLIPKKYLFYQNYPNPFNPITTLGYELASDSFVKITVYDVFGNVVKNLINADQSSGYKSVQWNATNNQGMPVASGVYLYSIEAGDFRHIKKMILLK